MGVVGGGGTGREERGREGHLSPNGEGKGWGGEGNWRKEVEEGVYL